MSRANVIEKVGLVTQALPNTMFRVKLEDEDREILAHLSGKMRMYRISIMPGDSVRVELTPYDPNRGRIVYRLRHQSKTTTGEATK